MSAGGDRLAHGTLAKLKSSPESPVAYAMPVGDTTVALNALLGERLTLRFEGAIYCVACRRKTNKSFNQGYCYPCFRSLAACDTCIMSPERCHFREGTCREPEWGLAHCMTDHVVYLANGTGLKVGITRAGQVPTRWIDQGAVQALPFARTSTRQQAGFLEVALKAHVSDRTHWQQLLKGNPEPIDLLAARAQLLERCAPEIERLRERFGIQAVVPATDADVWQFDYPVRAFPAKVRSLALEKLGVVEGELVGIKGQYLILSSGVINVRKYTGHEVELLAAG